jgi:hypothetical protein
MSADPIDWLSKNWAVLSSAPWVFVTLAAIFAVIGYTVGTWFKNGEISILERRVAEYEKKVGTPDEAKTKIDRLEGELAGLNRIVDITVGRPWTPLTSQEIADLSLRLRDIPKHRVQLMYLSQLGKPLAETLNQAFIKAGWSDSVTLSDGGGNHLGIIVGPGANKAGALKAAIEGTTRLRVSVDKPDRAEVPDFVYLFVGINPPETN